MHCSSSVRQCEASTRDRNEHIDAYGNADEYFYAAVDQHGHTDKHTHADSDSNAHADGLLDADGDSADGL